MFSCHFEKQCYAPIYHCNKEVIWQFLHILGLSPELTNKHNRQDNTRNHYYPVVKPKAVKCTKAILHGVSMSKCKIRSMTQTPRSRTIKSNCIVSILPNFKKKNTKHMKFPK